MPTLFPLWRKARRGNSAASRLPGSTSRRFALHGWQRVDLQLDSITAITEPQQESPLSADESRILEDARGRILLYHISGPMSFGAAKSMARRLAGFDEYDVLVLDLSDVPQIDFTSARAIDDMLHDAWDSDREAYLVSGNPQVSDLLEKQGVLETLLEDRLKGSRIEALKAGLQRIQSIH